MVACENYFRVGASHTRFLTLCFHCVTALLTTNQLTNPELIDRVTNPETLQAIAQMQQTMGPLFGQGYGGSGVPTSPTVNQGGDTFHSVCPDNSRTTGGKVSCTITAAGRYGIYRHTTEYCLLASYQWKCKYGSGAFVTGTLI